MYSMLVISIAVVVLVIFFLQSYFLSCLIIIKQVRYLMYPSALLKLCGAVRQSNNCTVNEKIVIK